MAEYETDIRYSIIGRCACGHDVHFGGGINPPVDWPATAEAPAPQLIIDAWQEGYCVNCGLEWTVKTESRAE